MNNKLFFVMITMTPFVISAMDPVFYSKKPIDTWAKCMVARNKPKTYIHGTFSLRDYNAVIQMPDKIMWTYDSQQRTIERASIKDVLCASIILCVKRKDYEPAFWIYHPGGGVKFNIRWPVVDTPSAGSGM